MNNKNKTSNKDHSEALNIADVSCSALLVEDLKCGNILNYDTAEGEVLPTCIDWQDIKWLSEDPKGFNLVHSPIPLDRDWLLKLGFIEDENEELVFKNDLANIVQTCFMGLWQIKVDMIGKTESISILNEDFLYVHQLQNLCFALTGHELTVA